MNFRHAYYIKLGRAGCWEADSVKTGKLRLGWPEQSLDDINHGRWDAIAQQLRNGQPGKPQVATTDLNRLRDITTSTADDLWVTFHLAKLWWARLAPSPIEEDEISKFRRTVEPWSDRSMHGRLLVANELPGKLAQLQGFRGTVCRVREADVLRRVLEGTTSPLAADIARQRGELCRSLERAIAELHWKDYETLVDLVFRHAGWIRISVLGRQEKGYDLELREPITHAKYVVQIKSQADLHDVQETAAQFSPDDYERVFFAVHTPSASLARVTDLPANVELVPPVRLAELAFEAGLSSWIEGKAI